MVRGAEDRSLGERLDIDRARLREILIASLPEGMLRWGHRLKAIEGKTLVFCNTSLSGYDVVVGAAGLGVGLTETESSHLVRRFGFDTLTFVVLKSI
ncbi:hypothetical protein JDV02_002607 [Purpureocillium takamizusanense]|uniref:Uncharacterized protein n=1 Tax=Purpureocillium takamizusanense TaxID=2060973 RepID=A0A9Q8QBY8_9HYPO|nr:uncharacterized protein JDV02_002607 [Purpureocillium takamizusanense]UNI16141.1 hypothetical protein JDV02_002607 [Purpureocillium takamizusanense]